MQEGQPDAADGSPTMRRRTRTQNLGILVYSPDSDASLPPVRLFREWGGFTLRALLGKKFILRIVLVLCSARVIPRRYLVRYFRPPAVLADVEAILRSVRSITGWSRKWARAAKAHEEGADIAIRSGCLVTACEHELVAALFYHAASSTLCTSGDLRHSNMAKADTAFSRAMAIITQSLTGQIFGISDARKLSIPWKGDSFTGWLLLPTSAEAVPPWTTLVIPGGADSGKEEYLHYARHFLSRGFAVLVMNDPGVGETARRLSLDPDGAALYDGVQSALKNLTDKVCSGRMFWLGASLGGWKVMQVAVSRGRADGLCGVVSISGPYRPERYYRRLLFAVHEMVRFSLGVKSRSMIGQLLVRHSLKGRMSALDVPALVVVGGRERIIPASDGLRMYIDIKRQDKRLLYLPDSDHVCMDAVDRVLPMIADWVCEIEKNLASGKGME